jgi:hypothetical protein
MADPETFCLGRLAAQDRLQQARVDYRPMELDEAERCFAWPAPGYSEYMFAVLYISSPLFSPVAKPRAHLQAV